MTTTTATATKTAREYLRVSLDKSGRERSKDEQHADNQRLADEHGWTLADPYDDTGSASRYAAKGRDGFDSLMADLAADRFRADVLILWESSRGSRRVGEWVTLIERCEERGVRIHVTTHGRTYDPANPRDRRSLLEDAVDSEYETAKLSSRAKRAARANAADGKPHGRVPYGYRRVYDERTGRLLRQEPEPAEAAVVVELFDRIRRGHSLRSIARDFEARGIRTRSGLVLSQEHLRAMAIKRLYVGERVHHGKVTEAQWPGLVDRATWHAVQNILSDPKRKTTRPGRGVHLLSHIAVCDVCGGPLAARLRANDPNRDKQYQCHRKSCVRVPYDDLNAYGEKAIIDFLATRGNVDHLVVDTDAGDLAAVRDEIAAIRIELDDLAAAIDAKAMTPMLAGKAEALILKRLEAAERREAELARPSALDGVPYGPNVTRADVEEMWRDAPMPTKRRIARYVLSPDVFGELRVTRSPSRGHRPPIDKRVVWNPPRP